MQAPFIQDLPDPFHKLQSEQLPIQNKKCEITAIPELLKLLDIRGSTVTIDAIGTLTGIMLQGSSVSDEIRSQGGRQKFEGILRETPLLLGGNFFTFFPFYIILNIENFFI